MSPLFEYGINPSFGPVMPDPRILIRTPSVEELVADTKALCVEVLGQEEADKLHAEAVAAVALAIEEDNS